MQAVYHTESTTWRELGAPVKVVIVCRFGRHARSIQREVSTIRVEVLVSMLSG
jgi:hypothetical protein